MLRSKKLREDRNAAQKAAELVRIQQDNALKKLHDEKDKV